MKLTRDNWIALILWLIVGGLTGAVVAALLAWQGRFVVLGAIIGLGVAALVIIRFLAQPLTVTQTASKVAAPVKEAPKVTMPTPENSNLSEAAAREWLDDFLVRQQQTQ